MTTDPIQHWLFLAVLLVGGLHCFVQARESTARAEAMETGVLSFLSGEAPSFVPQAWTGLSHAAISGGRRTLWVNGVPPGACLRLALSRKLSSLAEVTVNGLPARTPLEADAACKSAPAGQRMSWKTAGGAP